MHHGMNANMNAGMNANMNPNSMGNMNVDPKHMEHMFHLCKQHMNKKVNIQTVFGDSFNVFIDHVDGENVHLTLANQHPANNSRQWGFGYPGYGYGYGGYGFPGYGYGGGIGRFILPLTAIAALSVL
ncbi:hypothetical protein MUO14_16405 [Halobacillus shinanisalinarum]|uniref:Uncharacterized protein n=1 Tax=Halobacillus shinanisalinarum TaxID=2932258 RepID=A0ABY4GV74_9BACI|nr:hypothetical protein [Halobacillus shinanisalinarum]UOQ92066.1 hypothetical protein MUO14_16405 [Halobacillus shinanisalinarum]